MSCSGAFLCVCFAFNAYCVHCCANAAQMSPQLRLSQKSACVLRQSAGVSRKKGTAPPAGTVKVGPILVLDHRARSRRCRDAKPSEDRVHGSWSGPRRSVARENSNGKQIKWKTEGQILNSSPADDAVRSAVRGRLSRMVSYANPLPGLPLAPYVVFARPLPLT